MKPSALIFLILLFIFLPSVAHGATVSEKTVVQNNFGCITQELYNRFLRIAIQRDEQAFVQGLSNAVAAASCVYFRVGDTVYLDEAGGIFSGFVKLRPKGSTAGYWTAIEVAK